MSSHSFFMLDKYCGKRENAEHEKRTFGEKNPRELCPDTRAGTENLPYL